MQGIISDGEHKELTVLVEDGQRLTLRKATAMDILMDRGYTRVLDDMQSVDEVTGLIRFGA